MSEEKQDQKLVIVVLDDREILDDLLMGFVDLGVRGATVLDSQGMGQIIRQDMPIFSGLANLFPQTSGSVTILSVMDHSLVESSFELIDEIVGEIDRPNSAICFSLPVEQFRGIKH